MNANERWIEEVGAIARRREAALVALSDTRSVCAERVAGGYFVDFELRRQAGSPVEPRWHLTPGG